MRIIGHLPDEANARRFSEFLWAKSVANEVEADEAEWAIWVEDEEHVEEARSELERFRVEPEHSDYASVSRRAEKARQEIADKEKSAKKIQTRRDLFASLEPYGPGALTCVLIGICVWLAFLTEFGDSSRADVLYITEFERLSDTIRWRGSLPEVSRGEVWRLITPVLMHGSPLHLFFNMWWLFSFGSMIEARRSSGFLFALIVVSGALSNLMQYKMSSPAFLGFSGVVYALFGYLWMKGRFDRVSGMGVEQITVIILVAWFFICLLPGTGVANWCHGGGLVIGMLWGMMTSPGGLKNIGELLNRRA